MDKTDRKKFFTPNVEDLPDPQQVEHEELLQDLALFEQFREEVAPAMRAMVLRKAPPKEIRAMFESLLEARKVTIALTARDPAKALAAIRDIQDRQEGKAVERREIKHQLGALRDEEVDALLLSKLKEVEDTSER